MIRKEKKTSQPASHKNMHWLAIGTLVALISTAKHANAFVPGFYTLGRSCIRPISELLDESLGSLAAVKASATQEQISTSLPARKSKHRKRKKKSNRKHSDSKSNSPLAQEELAHHVACRYVTGPGGRLHKNRLKTGLRPQRSSFLDPSAKNRMSYLQKLEHHPALVLNADYQPMNHLPLSIWNWQDAIKAIFNGKVTVVDTYPDVMIRAVDLEIPLPSVIALNDYVPQFNQRPACTKRNVFLRDEYKCQYCNDHFRTQDLSLDHVLPRCRGGILKWENAVTSCKKCNGRKGSLGVHELRSVGMKLVREPFVPTQFQLASVAGKMLPRRVHPTWVPYLQYMSAEAKAMSAADSRQMADPKELFTDAR